jgi:(p)ppGpp synthase/HD superfamily hydrolase
MDLAGEIVGRGSVGYSLVEKAAISITEDFRDVRRHTGEKYEVHQRSVAVIDMIYCGNRDHRDICSDLMHDTPEDVPEVTFADVRVAYGKKVARDVEGVTKPPLPLQGGLSDAEYDEVCSQIIFKHVRDFGAGSIRLKCRDRLHNMLTLWGDSEKKLRKIQETIQYMLPLSIRAGYLWQELTMATSEQLARLHVDDTQVAK